MEIPETAFKTLRRLNSLRDKFPMERIQESAQQIMNPGNQMNTMTYLSSEDNRDASYNAISRLGNIDDKNTQPSSITTLRNLTRDHQEALQKKGLR